MATLKAHNGFFTYNGITINFHQFRPSHLYSITCNGKEIRFETLPRAIRYINLMAA